MQKEVSNNCDKTRNAEEVSHNCHKTRSAEKVFTIVKLTRDHKDGRCGPFGNTPLLHELTWLWECQAYCNSCHQSYGKKICSCKIENRVACRLQLFQSSSSSSLINIFIIIIIITTCCCCLGTCIVGSPLLERRSSSIVEERNSCWPQEPRLLLLLLYPRS